MSSFLINHWFECIWKLKQLLVFFSQFFAVSDWWVTNDYLQFCSSNTAPDEHSLEWVGEQTQSHFSLDHILLFPAQVPAFELSVHSHVHRSWEKTCFSLQLLAFIAHWQPHIICFSTLTVIHFSMGPLLEPPLASCSRL